jgi:protein-S-isoprenylcysteine O-methyltransferase Ste14
LLIGAGLIVLVHSFFLFFAEGLGTPAPLFPPERLVISGLYWYVRNPMYVALLATLIGQSLVLGQLILLLYAAIVWLVTAAWVRWYEEPALTRRFGKDYEASKSAVPAWWPRLHPWQPGERQ